MKLAVVGLVALLAQAIDLSKCGSSVVVDGPKTPECPSGRYVVTYDQTKTPPEASYRCQQQPGASPSAPSPSSPPPPSSAPPPTTTTTTTLLPRPSPTPPPSNEGWTTCDAPWQNLLCPRDNTCPASWASIAPSRVGVGDHPAVNKQNARRTKLTFSLSSKSNPPECPHRGNLGECEQWIPCAQNQDERGWPPVVWYAAYPGTSCGMGSVNVSECQVEHASRLCSDKEKAEDIAAGECEGNCNSCRRPNGWSLTDIVGEAGGPEGVRKVCAAPPVIPRGEWPIETLRQSFRYADWERKLWSGDRTFKRRPPVAREIVLPKAVEASCRTWDCSLSGCVLLHGIR